MKNISTPPQLPTFTVLTLLDLHGLSYIPIEFELPAFNVLILLDWRGLSYGQLAHILKVSRQAIAQAVKGIDDSSRIRVGVAKILGIKPSVLWGGVFDDEKLAIDDLKFSRNN
jgi:lambda repressor-like predicted transcriptional regulator